MSREVRQRVEDRGMDKVDSSSFDDIGVKDSVSEVQNVDWISRLPYDIVIDLFTRLSYRDRANLASTSRIWRMLGASPCLWRSLDLRAVKFDIRKAAAVSERCGDLQKVRFRGVQSASAIVFLQANNLLEISGDYCMKITDATLCMLAARHQALESLELGPDFCRKITSEAIKVVATCCKKLRKLWLSGVNDVSGEAIASLAEHCPKLSDLAFLDCLQIDEAALGKVVSVCYLSVAGTSDINWSVAAGIWNKLPKLTGLDVSRTDISPIAASSLLKSSQSLKFFCAVNCYLLTENTTFSSNSFSGTVVFGFDGVTSTFADNNMKPVDVFAEWRNVFTKNPSIEETGRWTELILSHTLLRIAESNTEESDHFWLNGGAMLLLSLMQSEQEDVQERAATGVATFVVVDDGKASIDSGRAEAVIGDGGIQILLKLVKSRREGLQAEAAKAIANLSVIPRAAKAVVEGGGISVIVSLAKSTNRLVAEEAAGALWNLSVGGKYKSAIAQAGGVEALVELITRWPTGCYEVVERAAGALANLSGDEKCSLVVAEAGGVHALVKLAQNFKYEGAQEQAARALANLAAHGHSNNSNAAVGKEPGAIETLVQLTQSPHDGVKQEAAGALWNLTFFDDNRESIAAFGGVKALVALANSSCSIAFPGLQERAAGALWGLAVSEAISIEIGNEGGIQPLVDLTHSVSEDVQETAAGALWNLAINSSNAMRIFDVGGAYALHRLCQGSVSIMARFMAALALAYMFDGRMIWNTAGRSFKCVHLNAAKIGALAQIEEFIKSFVEPQFIANAALSFSPTVLAQVSEKARILEAGNLKCGGSEIRRFVTMLRNPSPKLKACAAFALFQFTVPEGRHAMHHASLIQNTREAKFLRSAAAATNMSREGKLFAKIVLRNLEHHQAASSKG